MTNNIDIEVKNTFQMILILSTNCVYVYKMSILYYDIIPNKVHNFSNYFYRRIWT